MNLKDIECEWMDWIQLATCDEDHGKKIMELGIP
jgi:hypothetical protein